MLAVIADDDRLTVALVSKALQRWGVDVRIAHDGNAAWDLLGSMPVPSIAIVDWMMPGLDGIELCRRIRNTPPLAGIYVILLTARDSRPDLIAGLDAGADDYMVKPIDSEELRARVQVGFRVAALQARLSQRVSQLESARDHLARLASTDSLTGLHSRRWWFELAATEFSRSRRYRRPLTVMALDLDFFKRVNDTFGHDAGDRLLQEFADMLRFHCRQSDSIGRLGGEEFAVLVPEGATDAAKHLAERIGEACRNLSVATPAGEVKCSCSIGISQVSPEDENIAAALRRADAAMYEAKRSGRDRWKCVDVLDHSA